MNAQREFGFRGADETDCRIAGHQVDAKWSQTSGSWMLPSIPDESSSGRNAAAKGRQSSWSAGRGCLPSPGRFPG
ncbi:NaeI family type II restriction endonuclease [Rhodococcus kronopolitis]|uniref:NaeI family type II restriction endonuclease n=1 Tax=Rhodococcus kronopolitis TaxID=1460226 RepID=A0ABV9FUK0_9NOCA